MPRLPWLSGRVEASDTAWQLNMLGCGPMEDLLRREPAKYFVLLEAESAVAPKLVIGAASVWLDNEPIREQLDVFPARNDQGRL